MNARLWLLAALLMSLGLVFAQVDLRRLPVQAQATQPVDISISAITYPGRKGARTNLAKYEPENGCYLGAYIDLDPQLPASFVDLNGTRRKRPSDFESAVGREHAMYFFYMGYGRPLPMDYLRYLAAQDKYVQIALEPNSGLEVVQADDYLIQLAEDIRESGAKVFLRFASEMNGDWVRYHGDPAKYIEKWRLIAGVMRDRAPNVAMVWCPYAMPMGNVLDYYPGDEYVDWVGVNLYNVTYYNQNPNMPAKQVSPKDLLRPIYNLFADRKPIMICEYATTHFSALEQKSVPYFAANNILELYSSLPTEFPRVKGIYYFSSNNLALAHRRNNNYSLLEDPIVLEAYRRATKNPYFLNAPQTSSLAVGEPVVVQIDKAATIRNRVRLMVWAGTPGEIEMVRFSLDGIPVHSGVDIKDWVLEIDPRETKLGKRTLKVEAFDTDGDLVGVREISLTLENKPDQPPVSN